ncbi:GDSL-type esterase/lipase family protein [Holdemania massiliensis]|uniref:GDSL-type esterase/lipase family protein n=1 Tax=Holdemania massiliensis TaxID=1468449 RepID=UPI001F054589|nr:GDSL-type esterase/lipase family protein [Holdemania massiliensis]MCH1941108.1 GDSL-type esterase/lipase family protein [Holdemania massiliensis]
MISTVLLLCISIAFIAIGWINYGDRVLKKFGLAEYEMPLREQNIILGWNKSLNGYTADIVFFGDSITYLGDWGKYYEDLNVCNLSVSGDTIINATYRATMVEKLNPKKIFIMIGVNNLDEVNEYSELLAPFLAIPDVEIYVQSILPVRSPSKISNQKIENANIIIQGISEEYGCIYINLHNAFSDINGELRQEFSKDGIHINEKGYELWTTLINEYVYE